MSLIKNTAGQKWIVFAFDRTDNTPKTGDASNITANLRLDGGAANAVDDTNPTELEDGYYVFDLTQAETNADLVHMSPESSTADIQVIGVPGALYTTEVTLTAINSECDTAISDASLATAAALATVDSNVDAILVDTGTTIPATLSTIAGYLDTEIAAILVDTGTTIPALIAIAQADLDIITGADGVNLLSATQASIDAIEADTNELQGDWADGGRLDLIVDAVKTKTDSLTFSTANQVDCNMLAINSTATSAARLALSADVIIPATVDTATNTHTPTTTEFQADDITEATADHYNGRIVVFTSGALDGQATDITDYEAVGGIGQFTVTALTEAPSNNDTFIIL